MRVDRPGRGGGFVNGASIWFHLPEEPESPVELTITPEGSERVLRRFVALPEEDAEQGKDHDDERPRVESFEAERGLNRVEWDLKDQAPHLVEGAIMSLSYTGGPFLPPGTYRATLKVGSAAEDAETVDETWSDSRTFEVVADPGSTTSPRPISKSSTGCSTGCRHS